MNRAAIYAQRTRLDLTTRAKLSCPSCGGKVDGGKFCCSCGSALDLPAHCDGCGSTANRQGAVFCSDRGHKL